MTKYVMLAINCKYDDEGNVHVRRILLSYKRMKKTELNGWPVDQFIGTKIISKDEYFLDDTKSHQYIFNNNWYELCNVTGDAKEIYAKETPEIFEKRKYHTNHFTLDKDFFEAETDEEAIKIFNNREELK